MGTTTRSKFSEIFAGSPENLNKGGFMRWMRELREVRTAQRHVHRVELARCYDIQVQTLLPGEPTNNPRQAAKWIQAVGQVVDSTCLIVTTPIWGIVLHLSEGSYNHSIWHGTDDDRRRLTAAARAIRQFLVNEESGPYQEPASR